MASASESTDRERLSPLEAVLRRLRGSSGFPTLSTTISEINRVVSLESHSAQQLSQVILRDVSLTTALLQVVNAATYGQFRGTIRTVSKAVLILGTEVVRNAAMTLMMLSFSKGRPQEASFRDELLGAFFAGVVSKALCQRLGMRDNEEAVICAMCHSLGRLLVIFFLYEEREQVRELMETGLPEEEAARRVLGLSYSELGLGVARSWGLPEKLVEGMQSLKLRDIVPPNSSAESLRIAANLANDLYQIALRGSQVDKPAALKALSKRYSAAIKLDPDELTEAVNQGLKEIAERSVALNLPAEDSPALNVIRQWTGAPAPAANVATTEVGGPEDPLLQDVGVIETTAGRDGPVIDTQKALSAGIRDITETLTSDFELNDILQMALETMYRGMGFSHTMVFIRDAQQKAMRARFGFGADVERMVPQCRFPLAFAPDVFHVALEKGVDIVIENTRADNVIQRIPEWHRQVTGATSFLILPVMLKSQAVGLLYADSDRAEGIKINTEQLDLLRTLRTQVVLAFKQSGAAGRG
jgi:HD-like signal output (HDOD) protein